MTTYQAIETKYLGPTNTKGGRIKAECWGGNVTISYPHELDTAEAHKAAAQALIDKMTALALRHGGSRTIWNTGIWTQGGNAKGTGYVFTVTEGADA
jgi:hypothetical protein